MFWNIGETLFYGGMAKRGIDYDVTSDQPDKGKVVTDEFRCSLEPDRQLCVWRLIMTVTMQLFLTHLG